MVLAAWSPLSAGGCRRPSAPAPPGSGNARTGQAETHAAAGDPAAPPQQPVPAPVAPPNLLLITLDTTRADHLSCYGGPAGLTPSLDKLAAEGTLFENAFSQTNQTNPSHVSIMSGVPALEHGVMNNYTPLPDNADLLSLAFRRAGRRTAAFPSSHHVSTILGWRGFDDIYDVPPVNDEFLSAREVTDRAVAWLGEHGARPFFMWVHYFDPHAPYQPPAEVAAQFYTTDPDAGAGPDLRQLHPSIRKHAWLAGVRDLAFPRVMYQAEIHETDAHLGRLLEQLDALGLQRSTGVVVVGDHGENLGEHEMYFNHYFVFEPALRVPLIVRMPGFPPGVRVAPRVGHLDIVPTLAELYGLTIHHRLGGVSLAASLRGQRSPALDERSVFVHEHGKNRQVAVRDGRFKIVYTIDDITADRPPLRAAPGEVWVFDLESDPGELRNVAAEHADLVERHRARVRPWFELGVQNETEQPAAPLDERQRQSLKGLGYIDEDEGDPEP